MKQLIKAIAVASLMIGSFAANAGIMPISLPSSYTGTVASEDGWLAGDTSAIDFFVFSLDKETEISFNIDALTSFGMSLYAGELSADPSFLFSNSSDFITFTGESLTYLTGIDGFTPNAGENELDAGWLAAGVYTLALGGNEGISFASAAYTLEAIANAAQVPEPGTFILTIMGVAALIQRKKRNAYK
ncbi:PEP-CTERM sorting domain-containing protein [Alteromonas pelagimontana]|uniref:PEP-CTERM sorting domain-containing protein n=1 Tax=Alteromonas pelagimontana TaxID=1858656 RepID=A0A6M4MHL7_9ALTE|nr:PEP-CTERM sorting domain-containing protein [Alteromonas pelagimontana]QJR82408.1 PEP-CTERM sorting domain-containing protein [Alteromonas pelagimontana]